MALVRWEPARELHTIQQEMNRLFNTFFDAPASTGGNVATGTRRWIPPMDLVETTDHFVLRADLPGMSEEDLKIEVEDNVLTISGERKAEQQREGAGYFVRERRYGSFRRNMTLPEGTDESAISARFEDGVLEVRIAGAAAVQEPKHIQIEGAGDEGSGG